MARINADKVPTDFGSSYKVGDIVDYIYAANKGRSFGEILSFTDTSANCVVKDMLKHTDKDKIYVHKTKVERIHDASTFVDEVIVKKAPKAKKADEPKAETATAADTNALDAMVTPITADEDVPPMPADVAADAAGFEAENPFDEPQVEPAAEQAAEPAAEPVAETASDVVEQVVDAVTDVVETVAEQPAESKVEMAA